MLKESEYVMRFLILVVVLLACSMCGVARAEEPVTTTNTSVADVIKALVPNASAGAFYGIRSHESNVVFVGSLMEKETKIGTFAWDLGYGESDLGITGVSYKTETLSKVGINIPVLSDLYAKAGGAVGYNHISRDSRSFDYGGYVVGGAEYKF